uniref:Uncharacterized protein n=1 Tax=Brassica oleracea var. oleracea TaxID=109376 RepID=A0A0D3BUM5_BRAOL
MTDYPAHMQPVQVQTHSHKPMSLSHHQSSSEPPHAVTVSSSPPPLTTQERQPSCSSRRDEAIDTNHAAIGAQTKLLEPPKVSNPRARETPAPPQSAGATAHSSHALPSQAAVRWSRRARPPSFHRWEAVAASPPPVISGKPLPSLSPPSTGLRRLAGNSTRFKPFEGRSDSEFRPDFRFGVHLSSWSSQIPHFPIAKRRTSVCRIVWRLRPTLVDRLSCNLGVSINRLRAVSENYLELSYVFGLLVDGECALR